MISVVEYIRSVVRNSVPEIGVKCLLLCLHPTESVLFDDRYDPDRSLGSRFLRPCSLGEGKGLNGGGGHEFLNWNSLSKRKEPIQKIRNPFKLFHPKKK